FAHHPADSIPSLEVAGCELRVLVGTAFGAASPVKSFSEAIYLDVKIPPGMRLELPSNGMELGAYTARGTAVVNGEQVYENALAVSRDGSTLEIMADTEARIAIIGGRPFPEHREIWWNFVSSSKERIERAKADWASDRFPKVPEDDQELIP